MVKTIFDMRTAIKKAYPNSKHWSDRVDKMTDIQVEAIYFRLRGQNKI